MKEVRRASIEQVTSELGPENGVGFHQGTARGYQGEGGCEQTAGPGQGGGWREGRGQSIKALNDVQRTSQCIFKAISALESFEVEEPYNPTLLERSP